MAAKEKDKDNQRLGSNRRALHDYAVIDRLEAGIELRGTEVKSARAAQLSLAGSFAKVEEGEVILRNLNIPPYSHGNQFNHEPDRPRRLLLHRKEIRKLAVQTQQQGLTLVPLNIYLRRGLVKIDLGICKGKQSHDKRDAIRRKDADRQASRAMARYK